MLYPSSKNIPRIYIYIYINTSCIFPARGIQLNRERPRDFFAEKPLYFHATGVPGVFPGQTTGRPCKENWRRGEKHGRRGGDDEGALVRAEDTIYGHLVGEKEDRRGYEEHRVSSSLEEGCPLGGWHVPRKDFSTGGQRFGEQRVVRGGAMLERGGEVVQEWR